MPLLPPADYMLKLPDPTEVARKNAELASSLAQNQQNQQLVALKTQEAQQKQEAARVFQADASAFAQAPSMDAARAMIAKYPGEIGEHYKQLMAGFSDDQRKAVVAQMWPIQAALINEKYDVAYAEGMKSVEALTNAGKLDDAKALQAQLEVIKTNPSLAVTNFAGPLAAAMGEKEYGTAVKPLLAERLKAAEDARKAGTDADKSATDAAGAKVDLAVKDEYAMSAAKASLEKERAGTANLTSEKDRRDALLPSEKTEGAGKAREATAKAGKAEVEERYAERTAQSALKAEASLIKDREESQKLARKKLDNDTAKFVYEAKKVSPEAEKMVQAAAKGVRDLHASAEEADQLAGEFKKIKGVGSSGFLAKVNEWGKAFMGNEDKVTRARNLYEQILAKKTLTLLPPGPASDKDIMIVRRGFLLATANGEEIASFLRGVAKLTRIAAERESKDFVATRGRLMPEAPKLESGPTADEARAELARRKAAKSGGR